MKKNLLLAGMLILAGFILVPNFSEASTYDADTNTIHATPYSGNYTDHWNEFTISSGTYNFDHGEWYKFISDSTATGIIISGTIEQISGTLWSLMNYINLYSGWDESTYGVNALTGKLAAVETFTLSIQDDASDDEIEAILNLFYGLVNLVENNNNPLITNNWNCNVSTEAQLTGAIASPLCTEIILQNDITLTSTLEIDLPVMINGGNHIIGVPFIKGDNAPRGITITNNVTLKNLTVNGPEGEISGVQGGHAIYITSGTVSIDTVTVKNFQKGGIYINGDFADATITNSTVIGAGTTNVIAQNGIVVINGTGDVSNTTLSGFDYIWNDIWYKGATAIMNAGGALTASNNTILNVNVYYDISDDDTVTGTTGLVPISYTGGKYFVSPAIPTRWTPFLVTNETTYNTLPATYLASYPRNTRSGSLTSGTEADDLPWVAFPYAVGTDNTALRITWITIAWPNGLTYTFTPSTELVKRIGDYAFMVGLNEFTGTTGFTVDTIPVGKYTITLSANGTTYTTTLANGVCSNTYSNYPTCWPVGGGNWGGSSVSKDICPNGDNSGSYYDGTCGTTTSTGENADTETVLPGEVEDTTPTSAPTDELSAAYAYAYENGLTTMSTIQAARLNDPLTRAELAKLMSQYAIKVLGKTPDTSKDCSAFSQSIAHYATDLQGYMTTSCQLGIMGIQSDGTPLSDFMPDNYVIRAEFWAVFSRLLRGSENERTGSAWYQGHLNALKTAGIITDTTPTLTEIRGWVFLQLYRSANK